MGDDEEKMRMTTRVRELFHGRFSKQEVTRLLDNHGWNQSEAVDFVLNSEPHIVNQLLSNRSERDIVGLREDEVLRQNAERDRIPNRKRQFACEACDNVWWTRVPKRKPVSKCKKCRRKFDPIHEDEEYGWATFRCDCGNEFSGYGQKNVTRSECYSCHSMALAVSVRPPEARKNPKSRSRHSCNAPDCTHRTDRSTGNQPRSHGRQNAEYQGREYRGPRGYGGEEFVYGYGQYHGQVNTPGNFNGGELLYDRRGTQRGHTNGTQRSDNSTQRSDNNTRRSDNARLYPDPPGNNPSAGAEYIPSTCVHPESRQASGKKLVIVPSLPHRSSGSTVDSLMLDDDEASSVLSDFRPSVDVIPEDPDEDNNDADNNNSNDED